MEKWFVINKGADFQGIAQRFHIHPVTARLLRNREVIGDEEIDRYLNGSLADLYDPHLLKEADMLIELLDAKIKAGAKIRIIGDYDIDGVMSTFILWKGIQTCGGNVTPQIPDRIKDGYGINEHLIAQASSEGVDTIITCDNGIAALDEIAEAKRLGMTVLVTDHHENPYIEEDGNRRYLRSVADAVVNPKQPDCTYPYKELCGAAVAWKIIQLLYEKNGLPKETAFEFLEMAAFATVGDVMDLTGENRILVKEGLKKLQNTQNIGMQALIRQNQLEMKRINTYHIGFVLGPCVNASGRLETASIALHLFMQKDVENASKIAKELVELNLQRKDMTMEGVEIAKRVVEEGNAGEKVLVIFLPTIHESLAGIIAGRIRELFHKPVFVLTKAEGVIKGSGRSIEEYSMYEELCKCRELFVKFGGHPMAAGISLAEENVEIFRKKINDCCQLTAEEFIPKIKIDIAMPADYPDESLVEEIESLEPFGKGNVKPQFADKNIKISHAFVVGRNQNVLKLSLVTEQKKKVSAVYFGDIDAWKKYYAEKFGEREVERALLGQENAIQMSIVYVPEINEYQGMKSVQLIIRNYR